MLYSGFDLQIMTLTLWAEARGEPLLGQKAVAWVIRNRFENPGWWSRQRGDNIADDTIAAVCRDPWQFSCWNPNDPNRDRLENPATRLRDDYKALETLCEHVLRAEYDDDPTSGCDHYCTVAIAPHVAWAKARVPVITIGHHYFYRLGLDGKGA